MAKKVWIVLKERHTEEESWEIILGVYDNVADAIARVNEVFDDCWWDKTIIKAVEYEINKPTYDTL